MNSGSVRSDAERPVGLVRRRQLEVGEQRPEALERAEATRAADELLLDRTLEDDVGNVEGAVGGEEAPLLRQERGVDGLELGRLLEPDRRERVPRDVEVLAAREIRKKRPPHREELGVVDPDLGGREGLLERAVQQPVQLDLGEVPGRGGVDHARLVRGDLGLPAIDLGRARGPERLPHLGELEVLAAEREVLLLDPLGGERAEDVEVRRGGGLDHVEPEGLAVELDGALELFLDELVRPRAVRVEDLGDPDGREREVLRETGRLGAVGVDRRRLEREVDLGLQIGRGDVDVLEGRRHLAVEGGELAIGLLDLLRHRGEIEELAGVGPRVVEGLRHRLEREAREDADGARGRHVDHELFAHDEVDGELPRVLSQERALDVERHAASPPVEEVLGEAHEQPALDRSPAEAREAGQLPVDEPLGDLGVLAGLELQQGVHEDGFGLRRDRGQRGLRPVAHLHERQLDVELARHLLEPLADAGDVVQGRSVKERETPKGPELEEHLEVATQRDGGREVVDVAQAAAGAAPRRALDLGVDDEGSDDRFGRVVHAKGAVRGDDPHREHDVHGVVLEQLVERALYRRHRPLRDLPRRVREPDVELALEQLLELVLEDPLDLLVALPGTVDHDPDGDGAPRLVIALRLRREGRDEE